MSYFTYNLFRVCLLTLHRPPLLPEKGGRSLCRPWQAPRWWSHRPSSSPRPILVSTSYPSHFSTILLTVTFRASRNRLSSRDHPRLCARNVRRRKHQGYSAPYLWAWRWYDSPCFNQGCDRARCYHSRHRSTHGPSPAQRPSEQFMSSFVYISNDRTGHSMDRSVSKNCGWKMLI